MVKSTSTKFLHPDTPKSSKCGAKRRKFNVDKSKSNIEIHCRPIPEMLLYKHSQIQVHCNCKLSPVVDTMPETAGSVSKVYYKHSYQRR